MPKPDTLTTVKQAFATQQIDQLLLGKGGFAVLPARTHASGSTDLTAVFEIIYFHLKEFRVLELRQSFEDAINKILEGYDGIEPSASVMLMETLQLSRMRDPIRIPLIEIAAKLTDRIEMYKERLRQDKTGAGEVFPDGKLGNLRRISRIVVSLGGPPFAL